MHQNTPTTKSGTCPCAPWQIFRLSKKWLDGPLQNEESATNLGGFLYKIRAPNPSFLIHSYNVQKFWSLQNGEPGMTKYLSRIIIWKKKSSKIQRFILKRDDGKKPWSPGLT